MYEHWNHIGGNLNNPVKHLQSKIREFLFIYHSDQHTVDFQKNKQFQNVYFTLCEVSFF